MKKVPHTVMSDKKCIACGTALKANLIARKADANKCYKCFKGKLSRKK